MMGRAGRSRPEGRGCTSRMAGRARPSSSRSMPRRWPSRPRRGSAPTQRGESARGSFQHPQLVEPRLYHFVDVVLHQEEAVDGLAVVRRDGPVVPDHELPLAAVSWAGVLQRLPRLDAEAHHVDALDVRAGQYPPLLVFRYLLEADARLQRLAVSLVVAEQLLAPPAHPYVDDALQVVVPVDVYHPREDYLVLVLGLAALALAAHVKTTFSPFVLPRDHRHLCPSFRQAAAGSARASACRRGAASPSSAGSSSLRRRGRGSRSPSEGGLRGMPSPSHRVSAFLGRRGTPPKPSPQRPRARAA